MVGLSESERQSLKERGRVYGLGDEELISIETMLNRDLSEVELAVIGAMWSEHCSYKTSRKWLSLLPCEGERVICGPGENAGVLDVGDGYGVAFKIESHNHPSAIEPYQGAATGVGGILRDVFTMGARPIALLNALWFGDVKDEKTIHRVSGVSQGIGGYGNSVGIATVAGETGFHRDYNDNILVNAMAVGLVELDKLKLSKAGGIGNIVIYAGSRTGKDGVRGAVMASDGFNDEEEFERTTVQIADPFCGKRLMEACIEVVEDEGLVAMQDMGAAGLTSSSVEMSDKGGVGVELWLDRVPLREADMMAHEIMLSESQERMLLVVKPDAVERISGIFRQHDLEAEVIGKIVKGGELTILWHGEKIGELSLSPLASLAPVYDRPQKPMKAQQNEENRKRYENNRGNVGEVLEEIMLGVRQSSKRKVWEQYDRFIGGRLLSEESGNAAVLELYECGEKGLAVTVDSNPYYCGASPRAGGRAVVAENWRNLISVGAKPIGLTDNLNAGNPENPEIMWQFVQTIQGMKDAAEILELPFVSGNVSLYNETKGKSIPPTPVIGGVGLIEDVSLRVSLQGAKSGQKIILVGGRGKHLGCSLYASYCLKNDNIGEYGSPPYGSIEDINEELKYGQFMLEIINRRLVCACNDVSEGGLLVALTEMLIASRVGAVVEIDASLSESHSFWFGEDPARYVVVSGNEDEIIKLANESKIRVEVIGSTRNDYQLLLNSDEKAVSLERVGMGIEDSLERQTGW